MEFANVGRRSPSTPDLHVKARSQANPSYPQRFKVDDEHVPWAVPWDEYEPTVYTDKVVLEQNCETRRGGWADPPVPPKRAVIETRGSHELQSKQLPWVFDDRGRPLNPRGRTGMSNRGVLGKWGPNTGRLVHRPRDGSHQASGHGRMGYPRRDGRPVRDRQGGAHARIPGGGGRRLRR